MSARGRSRDLLRQYLQRRDPQGFYIIPISKEVMEQLRQLLDGHGKDFLLEDYGACVIIRTRSRSLAWKLLKLVGPEGLLDEC